MQDRPHVIKPVHKIILDFNKKYKKKLHETVLNLVIQYCVLKKGNFCKAVLKYSRIV